MSGEIQAMLLTMPAVMPFLKSGKLRAIATSGATRSPALPALPTLQESGVAGYEYAPWYGMFGPAALPKPVLARLNQASNKIIQEPAVRDQFARQGLEVQTMTSEQFAAILRSDVGKWGKIIRDVGVRAD
jgi:tripartite-type tricarboxylate transporter receptor subunit TctC